MLKTFTITGLDAISFTNRQASNSISAKPNYVAFLSPKAEIVALAIALQKEDEIKIITKAEDSQRLSEHLQKFAIIEDIEITEAQDLEDSSIALEDYKPGNSLIKLDLIDKYVDFNKGCFPGQEVLSKYKNIGLQKRKQRSQEYTEQAQLLFAEAPVSENLAEEPKIQEAIELLKKALKENPKNEEAFESLAVMHGRCKNYQEAIRILHQLELMNSKNIMAQTNLSIFYMQLGNKEKAEEHKALSTVLQFEEALK